MRNKKKVVRDWNISMIMDRTAGILMMYTAVFVTAQAFGVIGINNTFTAAYLSVIVAIVIVGIATLFSSKYIPGWRVRKEGYKKSVIKNNRWEAISRKVLVATSIILFPLLLLESKGE